MENHGRSKIDLVYIVSSVIIAITLAFSLVFTMMIYRLQEKSGQNVKLLLIQNQTIESLSRKVLQVNLLNSDTANPDREFNIYNLSLEIKSQLEVLTDSAEVMLAGGTLRFNREPESFHPIPAKYYEKVRKIKLLINAFVQVKSDLLKPGIHDRQARLELLTSIIGQLSVKNEAIHRDLKKISAKNARLFLVTVVVTTLLVVASFIILTSFTLHFLHGLRTVNGRMITRMQEFTTGKMDLTLRLNYQSQDEIGRLADGFDRFTASVQEVVAKTKSLNAVLQRTSENMMSLVEEISASTQEVTANVATVSNNASQQKEHTVSTAKTIQEQSESLREFLTTLPAIIEVARSTNATAKKGEETIQTALEKINLIFNVFDQNVQQVRELSTTTQEIHKVLEVIEQISQKTNLLSLNAAIEAARAGEAGSSFAVVADEIRALADQSRESTKQISGLVQRIQAQNQATMNSLAEGTSNVTQGRECMTESRHSVNQINEAVLNLESKISAMGSISQTQLELTDFVRENMREVISFAEDNASALEGISVSMDELNKSMAEINTSIQRLSSAASSLDESTHNLKT